jgi:hypothetical protein
MVGAHVFIQSVLEKTHLPVEAIALTPQIGEALGIQTDGTNAFSKLRFAVPYLCGFSGSAIFADGVDMLCRSSLAELWAQRNGWMAASVVKHDYQPSGRKYIGTSLESENKAYPRKNWSSLVVWECAHYMNRVLTPEFIQNTEGKDLHRFSWLPDNRIGDLPAEWNHIPQELPPNPDAKIVHFSLGMPGFEHYRHAEHAKEWQDTLKRAAAGLQYLGR